MTWDELAKAINQMSPEQRCEVVVATYPDSATDDRDSGIVTTIEKDGSGDPYLRIDYS